MAGIMDIVVRAQDQASAVLEQVGETSASVTDGMGVNWMGVSLALAAAGAAAEGMTRKQAPLLRETRILAARLGESEQTVKDWAKELSNVTFPLEDVVGLMDLASRRGLEGKQALSDYANFWDMVGDATGESALALAEAGVALGQIGIAAGDEAQALDAFGFIMDNTTMSIGDFLSFVERTGPELNDLGLDIDDTAAILGVLENELGLSGRAARQQFRAAVSEADGDLGKMLDTLGVSQKTLNDYRSRVEGAGQAVERNAAIHEQSFTPLQKLQAQISDVMFEYAGLFEAVSTLSPALIALPGILIAVEKAKLGLAKAGPLVAGALRGVGAAMAFLAANPVVLIVAAIVGLIAAIVLLWQRSETFRNIVLGVWRAVQAGIGAVVGWIMGRWEALKNGIAAVIGFFGNMRDRVVGFISDLVAKIRAPIDAAAGLVKKLNPFSRGSPSLVENVERGVDVIRRCYEALSDMVIPGPSLEPAAVAAGAAGITTTGGTEGLGALLSELRALRSDLRSLHIEMDSERVGQVLVDRMSDRGLGR